MSMDNYIRGKVLGKGSFGSAILVTSKKDNRNYVIKEIDISRMPAAERESAKLEAQVRRDRVEWGPPPILRSLPSFAPHGWHRGHDSSGVVYTPVPAPRPIHVRAHACMHGVICGPSSLLTSSLQCAFWHALIRFLHTCLQAHRILRPWCAHIVI